ncbi:ParA family protein (plasmid) [Kovacikia minuta CCNUW1]|uniref:ParA family protein n=1 Tax=Kovacikia minuta TaxID=2931930 RepID=UPI001CCE38EB|nr:ParA family protein [Kovacikia minuta]UBF30194.1 ParA family protein [Kovacikia minuta CCNUW1]
MELFEAPTLVPLGLAGGQGKTTVALITGRILASYGIPVLFVDADPQASLTTFLGVEPSDNRPTLLEVITKSERKVPLYSAIHPVPKNEKLFVIPANDELEDANAYLAASGISLNRLRERLYQVEEQVAPQDKVACNFGVIIVDPPPERSHLALSSLGAGSAWVIPAEANVKGVESLKRTLELIQTYQRRIPHGSLIGVMPFRAQWTGLNPTGTTRDSIEVMQALAGKENVLPHLLESNIYKRAINEQVLPRELGKPELEYPLLTIIERMKPLLGQYAKQIQATEGREVVLQ